MLFLYSSLARVAARVLNSMRACALGACLVAVAFAAPPVPTLEAAVAQAARQLLLEQAERAGLLAPSAEVSVLPMSTQPGAGAAAPCAQPPLVEAVDTRFASRMRFAARCPGSDAPRSQYVVRGQLSAEVVVAAVALPAGRPIAAAEVMLDRRDVTLTPDAVSDTALVAGQASLRPMSAGQVVQKRLLADAVMVKRGDTVQIEVNTGAVQVSAVGEALEPGRRGDVVRVRNTSTGKVIRARVTAPSTVQPADAPMSNPP